MQIVLTGVGLPLLDAMQFKDGEIRGTLNNQQIEIGGAE